jgi:dipeptidyl aminopeptidase/acylaminoacyl peptidase
MNTYLLRLLVVAGLFLFFVGAGVLITQEGGRIPLSPEPVAAAAGVYDFSWSPDGRSIAFISSQGGSSEIWTANVGGGLPRRLTGTGATKKHVRWSLDGKWIAFVVVQAGNAGDIHLIDASGEDEIALTETPADEREPAWSPDSRTIAFTERGAARNAIVLMDVETRQSKPLVEVAASSLQWSPDSKTIAFVSDPLLSNDERRDNDDLFLISAEGGPPRLLTPGTQRYRDFAPSWSPDSRMIAYASENSGFSNIYVLDTQTGSRRQLTAGTVDSFSPMWSSDGQKIAYVSNGDAQFHVWVTRAEGGGATKISDRDGVNGGFDDDGASPRGKFQWSPDGTRIAFTHSDPGRTSDVWLTRLDGSRALQVTNSMPAELRREARFVWPDLMTYRTFDGREVSSLVYKPRGLKPRSGHPALLVFRDTLDGQHAKGWDPFIQFFVSDGYVVFAPNVRGSSGRGKDYRQLVFEHGGDYDIRDAFIGLDRLSSEGLIDAERTGVLGAGTGGFLATAALVKDETRFKAAVCLYGIVDAVTAVSYPGMESWSRYMIGASPMTAPLPFYERSLTNFVDKLRTPIVFLYIGNDPSTPFQQLQQFAVQAEVKGKWFDYRIFENESDGWQYWRPNNLRLALEATDALFEKHLLGRDREIRLSRDR